MFITWDWKCNRLARSKALIKLTFSGILRFSFFSISHPLAFDSQLCNVASTSLKNMSQLTRNVAFHSVFICYVSWINIRWLNSQVYAKLIMEVINACKVKLSLSCTSFSPQSCQYQACMPKFIYRCQWTMTFDSGKAVKGSWSKNK